MRPSRGFTLIEVLIAATILITVSTTAILLYRSALLNETKLASKAMIYAAVPEILAEIRDRVRAIHPRAPTKGQGNYNDINFFWSLTALRNSPPAAYFDPDSGERISSKVRYRLWRVHLRLSAAGVAETLTFRELTWDR